MKIKIPSYPYFLWLLCLLLVSCFEGKKACLDITATNFDTSADESCCCEYPLLKANIIHRVNDTISLALSTFYSNGSGDSFAILDFAYYLSDFTVYKQSETFFTNDTVHLGILQGIDTVFVPFRDDMITVKRFDAPIHLIDTFKNQGIFSDISFRIGLKDSLKSVLVNKCPAGHPLGSGNQELYDTINMEYSGLWMKLLRMLPNNQADTLLLRFAPNELPSNIHKLTSTMLEQPTGFDLEFTIKVDYSLWMQNVDIQTDKNAIKSQILQNLVNGITVYQQ